jgi:CheY-like chemotaxis protein
VLVVDSSATNRHILCQHLTSWGMLPVVAVSGEEALTLIRQGETFDVIMLDMHLSDMNGLKLVNEIQAFGDAQQQHLLIWTHIVQRGELNRKEYDSMIPSEVATCLVKPIRPSTLYNTLVRIFQHSPSPAVGEEVTRSTTNDKQEFDHQMGQRHPMRLLLAEDNVINQKVALRLLERLGYRADVVSNGLEVLEALKRQWYDVILMDVQMPEMDGIEAMQTIRRIWPVEQQPHIIAVTAHALQGQRERLLQAGMDDYISKPVRLDALITGLTSASSQIQQSSRHARQYGDSPHTGSSEDGPGRASAQTTTNQYHADMVSAKHPSDAYAPDATGAAARAEAAVDTAVLYEFLETIAITNPADVQALISDFLDDTDELLAGMRHALQQRDVKKFTRLAHTLKSSSAQFGALTLSRQCSELEAMGKAGTIADAGDLLLQTKSEYMRVKDVLAGITIVGGTSS